MPSSDVRTAASRFPRRASHRARLPGELTSAGLVGARLTTLDGRTRKYGERLLDRLRRLFRAIHRREKMRPERFERALERERKEIVRAARHPPWTGPARNPACEPREQTGREPVGRVPKGCHAAGGHNLAEQALRFVVIDRRITQGTRGAAGRAWCERMWTAAATCRQQGRSVFEFLHRTLHAHQTGQLTPSLLPA